MTSTVRIGVIGVRLGRWHVESFGQVPGCEVQAVCDMDPARLADVQSQFGVARTYERVADILADPDLDAVSVCLPNHLHAEVAVAALQAGKHVLIEKPLARTAAEGEQIVDAARRAGKQAMVAMKFRFSPEAQFLKRHVESGALGNLYYGWNRYIRPVGKGIPGRWFCRRQFSGGGSLIDNGVHMLDITWHLMGHPAPVEAFGSCSAQFGPRGKGLAAEDAQAFDVDDFAAGMIRFANGATILLDNAWVAHVHETQIGAWVCGTEGSGSLWPFRLVEDRDGASRDVTPAAESLAGENQFAHFVRSVRDNVPNASPAQQGLVMLRMLEALYHSSQLGCSVRVATRGTTVPCKCGTGHSADPAVLGVESLYGKAGAGPVVAAARLV